MRKLGFVIAVLLAKSAITQTPAIDSLRVRLVKQQADTNYIKDLNELAWQYLDYSSDSAQKYVQRALQLAEAQNFTNGKIDAKNTLGILYRYAGESQKAIAIYDEIISLRTRQGRLDKLTGAFANKGSVYYELGDNAKALQYYLKAQENAEKFHETENQILLLNNIGNAYKGVGLYELSINAFQKALQLNKSKNDEVQDAYLFANIATVYDDQSLDKDAYNYSKQAYDIFKKTKNVRGLSSTVNNLALYSRRLELYKETEAYLAEMKVLAESLNERDYFVQYYQAKANYHNDTKNLKEAMKAIDAGLALGDSIEDGAMFATGFSIKANLLLNLQRAAEALSYYERAIKHLTVLGDKQHLPLALKGKAEVLNAIGRSKEALALYVRADEMLDSLKTDGYNTKVAAINALNQLDKKEKELQLTLKEKETAEAKTKQQTQFLTAAMIIGLLVLVMLILSLRAYRIKKRDNALLSNQKREIETKNRALQQQNTEIEHQKLLIEEKQKEILSSIHYAKRIQRTLLANKELVDQNIPENFILFKPKDIVSGDFYWASEHNGKFYLAVCDSTGHGVPGAFMSLLNISFLNEAIREKHISEPNGVFDFVRRKLIESISQDGAKDGMDGILICYDKLNSTLTYAAANNKPVLVSAQTLTEFPADKMPIGRGEIDRPFALHSISVQPGDALYLYSDGYADQFGGENGKKFKYKMLQAEILKHTHLPFSEQLKRMDEVFENWRGQLEQVDDVLLVGLRF